MLLGNRTPLKNRATHIRPGHNRTHPTRPTPSFENMQAIASSTSVRPQFAGAKKSFAAKKVRISRSDAA